MRLLIYTFNCCSRRYSSSLHSGVRVRFAPSPTGFLHLGGLRTALYNYLFAKKNAGKFVLRIEDTDQKRVKLGSVENLNSMLKWTGLIPDESPEVGGPFSPYVQSERLEIYKEHANILLEKGLAYRCFCSETRLNLLRKDAQINRSNYGYDNKCRHLSPSDERKLMDEGKSFTIRFKIPENSITHKDVVYGESTYNLSENEADFVLFHGNDIVQGIYGPNWILEQQFQRGRIYLFEHKIILKSDGFPTYHFSCVIDDHFMEISHVLRGTEWLISTSKHILLHQAFGWIPPKFAHLPLLVNSDRTKLSKRQEAISVEYFKDKGYFPEALVNFLAAAGGGFGKDEGCITYDLATLASKFQLENMNTNSCIVDLNKLDLFNQNYIAQQLSKEVTTTVLIDKLRCILKEKYGQSYENEKENLPDAYMLKILMVYKDRLSNLLQLVEKDFEYLWTAPNLNNILKKIEELKFTDNVIQGWKSVVLLLKSTPEEEFTQNNLADKLRNMAVAEKISYGPLMKSLRIVLTELKDGPGIAEILAMLGKERSVNKINDVLKEFSEKKYQIKCKF